jgi:hypothetical protein
MQKERADAIAIEHVFAPLNWVIGMKVCKAILNMKKIPDYVKINDQKPPFYYTTFYKKKIETLSCSFELHFHCSRLFLYQIVVYDSEFAKKDIPSDVKLSEFLLKVAPQYQKGKTEGPVFYKDYIGAVEDILKSRFMITNPDNKASEEFLALRRKKTKTLASLKYQEIFVKPALD